MTKKTTAILAVASAFASIAEGSQHPQPNEPNSFTRLSPEAQDYIVDAMLGVYDEKPPEDIPESVKKEIREWANEDEDA